MIIEVIGVVAVALLVAIYVKLREAVAILAEMNLHIYKRL